jgi:hypothetical protein
VRIVRKRQRRLTGVDEMVLSLSAKGLTHGEIAAHLAEVYMALMSPDPTGKGRKRWAMRWKAPLNAFQIAFEGRLTPAAH